MPAAPRVYDSMIDTIGHTPLVRLPRLGAALGSHAELLGKLEFFNPAGSVKDRIGAAMLSALEEAGALGPGVTVVEATSGNTGIALAFVCAAKGYRLILCMPESMSAERRKMLAHLGAELELTPAGQGMKGALARADALRKSEAPAVIPSQFENPANPAAHEAGTAQEIIAALGGAPEALVCGVGTGGTITGIGRALRAIGAPTRLIAVEPEDSAVLSGGPPGPHKIQGIGAGFQPKTLDLDCVDEVVTIGNQTAFETARLAARLEGCPCGISSGAALAAAAEIGARPAFRDGRIVVVLASFAERYLSTPLFEGS